MGNAHRYKCDGFQAFSKKLKKNKNISTAQIHCAVAPNLCINKQNKKGGSQ